MSESYVEGNNTVELSPKEVFYNHHNREAGKSALYIIGGAGIIAAAATYDVAANGAPIESGLAQIVATAGGISIIFGIFKAIFHTSITRKLKG